MKLYYIDDSMFQSSPFSQQILFRFERYLHLHGKGVICISSGVKENSNIAYFCDSMKDCMIIRNPSSFDIEGVRGNLHTTFLEVEDFPIMQTYSGSFILYDTDKKSCERVYLDMFIEHEEDMEEIIQEMEQMINEKFKQMKKKTILN